MEEGVQAAKDQCLLLHNRVAVQQRRVGVSESLIQQCSATLVHLVHYEKSTQVSHQGRVLTAMHVHTIVIPPPPPSPPPPPPPPPGIVNLLERSQLSYCSKGQLLQVLRSRDAIYPCLTFPNTVIHLYHLGS